MIKEVLTYPNPILRKKSQDVLLFDEKLHTLLDDMYDTMMEYAGVGLAAIQISVPLNVLIISLPNEEDFQDKEDLIEAINPKITHKDGEQISQEGCLSIPGFNEDVKRAQHIVLEYHDRNGKLIKIEAQDFPAVAWQHEMEHLAGHVFIENLSVTKRKKFEKDWKKEMKNKK